VDREVGHARIQIINRFRVFELMPDGSRKCFDSESKQISNSIEELPLMRTSITEFPCILCANGAPWYEANKYLLESVFQNLNDSVMTSQSIAQDLLRFLRYLESENIDFRKVPKRKPLIPHHRFRFELKQQVEDEKLAPRTAKRCIGRIEGFYRWAVEAGLISSRLLPDNRMRTKYFAIRTEKSKIGTQSGLISDGGSLCPLTPAKQAKLLSALSISKNIEMRLVFITALLTGLRIQSVLTLDKSIFESLDCSSDQHISVAVGFGTKIETKYDKPMVVSFPRALIEKLELYYNGERSSLRRNRYRSQDFSSYVFLTNRGRPYYITNEDRILSNGQCKAEGAAIREYMKSYLFPIVGFRFKFHDLRATFALNLVDAQLELVKSGERNLTQVRLYVKERLGHASSEVTDQYLNYRQIYSEMDDVQISYEEAILESV